MKMTRSIDDDGGAVVGAHLFGAIYRRALAANAIGAAVAFVYLTQVSPPQPPPPHDEALLFLVVAPFYVVIAAVVGHQIGRREFRPIERWLAERRPPTDHERELILSAPWRTALRAAAGWIGAALVFGFQTATHHPLIYVTGVVVGILLAGLTSTAVTLLLIERTLRPVFARALAGEVSPRSESLATKVVRTRPRLLASWALGSGIALIAIPWPSWAGETRRATS